MKYATIDRFIRDVLAIAGDTEYRNMLVMKRIVPHVLNELGLTVLASVQSMTVKVNGAHTIHLPDSVERVIKVGKVLDNGCIRVLGKEGNRIKRSTFKETEGECTCGEKSNVSTDLPAYKDESYGKTTCLACTFHNWNGLGEAYGYREPQFPNGRYHYNAVDNVLEFYSGDDVYEGSELLLEYVPLRPTDKEKMYPVAAFAVLRYKCLVHYYEDSDPGKASYNMQQFKIHLKEYKKTLRDYSLEDIYAAFAGNYSNRIR